jgi:hypothetical protein
MRKAGGIIALIGGIFGVLAAIMTLSVGGIAGTFNAHGAHTVVGLGFGGLAFSFLAIIFSAVCLGTSSRVPAILLVISAIGGAILGGTLVAVCMVLAFVGGVLALVGADKPVASAPRAKRPKSVADEDEGMPNADDLIARQLAINAKAREASQAASASDAHRANFGKRRAV